MIEQPTDRREITTSTIDGRKHLVRVIPSDRAGPHGCNTLCGLALHTLPNPDVLEFGPGLPDEAERPNGICTTCWKALCRSGVWKRESWSLETGPLEPAPQPPAAPKPRKRPATERAPSKEPDPPDPNIWRLYEESKPCADA